MMRVAFPLNFRDRGWMGGINYFSNLFEALKQAPDCSITPVIVAGPSADRSLLASLGAAEQTVSTWGDNLGWRWKLRRALTLGLDRDVVFERILRAQRIDLLSHLCYLGRHARMPSLRWIPDFQERYLPEFFTALELAARERENRRIVRHASAILLSSEHAREGLAQISRQAADRAFVLPFVASVPAAGQIPSRDTLAEKYGNLGEYYFLPNQFWAHKNHEVVIRALGLLRRRGEPVTVIATGNPHDHRQPLHGQKLMNLIDSEGVADDFRVLGMVPYPDLMGLLAHAVALLNPSLFEGWSTTVEEAKSLGKQAIVSDIPIFREQAPARAVYFDPHDSGELAEVLLDVMRKHRPDSEMEYMRQAAMEFPARRRAFARRYEEIVQAVVGESRGTLSGRRGTA